jgi:hypothetical protein
MECLIEHPPSVLAFGCSVLAALCRQGLLQGTRAEHKSEGHLKTKKISSRWK